MSPREKATQELLYFIDRFAPGSENVEIHRQRLAAMSDSEFEAFIERLEQDEEVVAFFSPNFTKHPLTLKRNFEIAKELDHEFRQHLYLTDPHTGQVVKTAVKHMVLDLPVRRQVQMLYTSNTIPEHNRQIDERSGQATGASAGARLSYPEIQVNAAKGLDAMIVELIKLRGGDEKAFQALNQSILTTGGASQNEIMAREPTTVKSTQTLAVYLKAMHLDNNL